MKTLSLLISAFAVCSMALEAQVVPRPIDTFERVRWRMPIAQLRTLDQSSPLTIDRDRKTGKIRETNGNNFFRRREIVFGMELDVSYVIAVSDSTLQRILITTLEFSRLKESPKGVLDSLWFRVGQRYGASEETRYFGVVQRTWTFGATIIQCIRTEGDARGVVVALAPSPPTNGQAPRR
jgi:hypothetical protein